MPQTHYLEQGIAGKKDKEKQLERMFPKFGSAMGKAALLTLLMGFLTAVLSQGALAQTGEVTVLFSDDFEDGIADGWKLETGWGIELEDVNHLLRGMPFIGITAASRSVRIPINHTMAPALSLTSQIAPAIAQPAIFPRRP